MNGALARLETDRASIYLQQLCKHFAHKMPVEFTPLEGSIPFSSGTCRLDATGNTLTLQIEAEDEESLVLLQGVVEKHLLRFAFREPIKFEWHASSPN